jgi:hypothetical protein
MGTGNGIGKGIRRNKLQEFEMGQNLEDFETRKVTRKRA